MDLIKLQETHKKYFQIIQAVSGVAIFLLLATMWFMLIEDRKLKTEISENCGWGEDDYQCYCQKSDAIALKNLMDQDLEFYVNLSDGQVLERDEGDYDGEWRPSNVSLDR